MAESKQNSPGEAQPIAPARPPQPVRLRLIYFFIWTLIAAAFLLIQRWTFASADYDDNRLFHVVDVVESMLYGAAIGCVLLFAWRWIQCGQPPSQPGHWLLLQLGMLVLIRNTGWAVAKIDDGSYQWSAAAQQLFWLAESLAGALATLSIAALAMRAARWRAFFLLLTAAFIGRGLSICTMFVLGHTGLLEGYCGIWQLAAAAAAVLTLTICVWLDLARGQRRDLLHWVGVVGFLLETVIFYGLELYFMYVPQVA